MKKIPQVLKKALDLCAVARVEIVSAEESVARAEKALEQAKKRLDDETRKFENAFFKCGGVEVWIRSDGHRSLRDDPMGYVTANNLFVSRHAALASGKKQKISELKLPIDSSRARTLQVMFEPFWGVERNGVAKETAAAALGVLVDKLCEMEVLAAENKFVAVEGFYFMKDGDRWVSISQ